MGVQDREEEPLMEHPDENDLPDSAIKAMWDEGEPVELAAGPVGTIIHVAPSPWSKPPPNTALTGEIQRSVTYFSFFGAGTPRYPVKLTDASDNLTSVKSA